MKRSFRGRECGSPERGAEQLIRSGVIVTVSSDIKMMQMEYDLDTVTAASTNRAASKKLFQQLQHVCSLSLIFF
ncbi:unnamed protein product [Toxocara canis]|uniref:Uncharacterized protein n=1 Tax=Toxocara canis TaxID=6265 RepID=A0A183VDC5_TOXCA|nr:unnamed protein product [Toxocara canis]